jgi:hypothetical protein
VRVARPAATALWDKGVECVTFSISGVVDLASTEQVMLFHETREARAQNVTLALERSML